MTSNVPNQSAFLRNDRAVANGSAGMLRPQSGVRNIIVDGQQAEDGQQEANEEEDDCDRW